MKRKWKQKKYTKNGKLWEKILNNNHHYILEGVGHFVPYDDYDISEVLLEYLIRQVSEEEEKIKEEEENNEGVEMKNFEEILMKNLVDEQYKDRGDEKNDNERM